MTLASQAVESPESGVFTKSVIPASERVAVARAKWLAEHRPTPGATVIALRDNDPLALDSAARSDSKSADREACLRALSGAPTLFVEVSARDLANHVAERVYDLADRKGTDVIVHASADKIWVQPTSFAQAIYELLENAVEATRPFHPVVVDVRATRDGDVHFQIGDSGNGMPEELLWRLQGRVRPSRLHELDHGLMFAWRVIDRHGGVLRFESGADVGTTASVWLPARG